MVLAPVRPRLFRRVGPEQHRRSAHWRPFGSSYVCEAEIFQVAEDRSDQDDSDTSSAGGEDTLAQPSA